MGRAKQIAGTVGAVVLGFLALGDAPEQLANWKRGFAYVVSLGGIDWSAFWSGAAGRWVLSIAAVIIGLWAWDVPERAIAKFGKRTPHYTGGWWERQYAKRILRPEVRDTSNATERLPTELDAKTQEIDRTRAVEQLPLVRKELERQLREVEHIRGELSVMTHLRDQSLEAWKECKRRLTLEHLERFGETQRPVEVVVRTAGYQDWNLREQVEVLLTEHAKWPVTQDVANTPRLDPAKEFKIVLVMSDATQYWYLRSLLSTDDGGLLPCRVGLRQSLEVDAGRLVVEILPTATP